MIRTADCIPRATGPPRRSGIRSQLLIQGLRPRFNSAGRSAIAFSNQFTGRRVSGINARQFQTMCIDCRNIRIDSKSRSLCNPHRSPRLHPQGRPRPELATAPRAPTSTYRNSESSGLFRAPLPGPSPSLAGTNTSQ